MKRIYLSGSHTDLFVLVDDEDYRSLSDTRWFLNNKGYAGDRKRKLMHRIILGNPVSDIDHINHNLLDNRRRNLRLCTDSQNAFNRKTRIDNSSGYKGVDYHKLVGKWQARIQANGSRIFLGWFGSPEDAAKAYNKKAKELFGEYAHLNEL